MGLIKFLAKTAIKIGVINVAAAGLNLAAQGLNTANKAMEEKTKQKQLQKDMLLIGGGAKQINIPYGHKHYEGMYYKDVVRELKQCGFENCHAVEVGTSLLKCGNVKTISIGGNTWFNKKESFLSNQIVAIYYYG